MSICIEREKLLSINSVPARLEKITGKRLSLPTVYRWINFGIAGVKLESVCIGGTQYVSQESLDRFFAASTEARRKRHAKKTRQGIKRARIQREADRLGI